MGIYRYIRHVLAYVMFRNWIFILITIHYFALSSNVAPSPTRRAQMDIIIYYMIDTLNVEGLKKTMLTFKPTLVHYIVWIYNSIQNCSHRSGGGTIAIWYPAVGLGVVYNSTLFFLSLAIFLHPCHCRLINLFVCTYAHTHTRWSHSISFSISI